ncbi:MAG: hypothetical protein IJP45_09210 [Paludibacteraceae bacterium]|nr:hypothetical protein [Paludibacteraceae bacterium]
MSIIQYTDPTQQIRIKGLDLTAADRVFVTYECGDLNQTFETVTLALDGEDTVITVQMTQEFTAQLTEDYFVQINWLQTGKRLATKPKRCSTCGNLLREVIV